MLHPTLQYAQIRTDGQNKALEADSEIKRESKQKDTKPNNEMKNEKSSDKHEYIGEQRGR
jgi:hypothetical protein